MKEKIKKLFKFLGRAWNTSWRGKMGIIILMITTFMFIRMFFGQVSIQNFIINIWRLNREQHELVAEQKKLEIINRHIKLLQNYSPDYVQEIGLKYLNIGDPKFKTLKY